MSSRKVEQKKVGCMAVPELWTWFLLAAVWKLVISLMLTFLHFQVCMTLSQEPVPPLYKEVPPCQRQVLYRLCGSDIQGLAESWGPRTWEQWYFLLSTPLVLQD